MSHELTLAPGEAPPDFATGTIYFVGTATVLLRYAGFTILTDPNFLHKGDHVHLGYGLTSKRLTDPAMELHALPPLDLIVLSHLHEDHFDKVVEARLDRTIPIVTTPHAARSLTAKGFQAMRPLATWETLNVHKGDARVRITSMPARHGPAVLASLLPPTMGSLIEFQNSQGANAFRIYISGDTLVYDQLKEVPRRYPEIDLGLFHLGGTMLLGLVMVTMDAQQGVEAVRIINPRAAIPIHYDDYTVFKSPLDDFRRAVDAAGLQDRVHYLDRGETYTFEVPARRFAQ
jgi:L-ascorbate metabolism protein UlaG (beta-lactamase superfamily)